MKATLGTAVGVLLGIQACDGESATAGVTSTTLPCSSRTAAGSARGGFYVQTRKGGAATTTSTSTATNRRISSSDDRRSSKGDSGNGTGFVDIRRRGAVRVRGGAVVSDPYHARMQVMITRNMRKVLVEELDYLPDEVDDMDPQIAAVVIEKSLPRPRAGMPIAWRRSIRHKESIANPVSALTKALQGAAGGVLKGVASVLAFPLRVVKGGGPAVSVVVATAAVLALFAASSTDSSETGDVEGSSPGFTGLRLLEDKLGGAKALLWKVGTGAGGSEEEEAEGEAEKKEAIQDSRWSNKYFGKARGVGDDSSRPLDYSATTASQTPPSPPRGAEGGGLSRARNFRETSDGATHSNAGGGQEKEEEEEDTSVVAHRGRGGGAAIGKNVDLGIENGSGMAGGGSGGGGGGAPDTAAVPPGELHANVASGGDGDREGKGRDKASSDAMLGRELYEREGDVAPASGRRRMEQELGRRDGGGDGGGWRGEGYGREGGDGDERCPDAPAGPNTGSAVWFEELPPASPAPSTIGVLEEGEGEEGMEDDRPRWGRKPMSEHIPDEEEMEAWESKIEASDTWLDKGINRAMTNLFGGGGKGDNSSG